MVTNIVTPKETGILHDAMYNDETSRALLAMIEGGEVIDLAELARSQWHSQLSLFAELRGDH